MEKEVKITMTLSEEQKKFILNFLQAQVNKNPLVKQPTKKEY
jgi:hypothetical protein